MSKVNIKQTTWDLSPLLASDDELNITESRKKVLEANDRFVEKWEKRTDYLSDSKVLKEALDEYEELMRKYGTSGAEQYYFWLRQSQDQVDPEIKAKFNKAHDFSVDLLNKIQFFELRLAKIKKDKQAEFLKDKNLEPYKHFLEKIFKHADYLLSENEEKIINLKSDPAYQKWTQMLSSFLSKEEREVITESGKKEKKNLEQLLTQTSNKNKKVRDAAALAINDILAKYAEVAEAEINAIMANKKIDDYLRNIDRPDMSRFLDDDVDAETVDVLLKAVANRFDISDRYYALKAKLLGLKKLEYHERGVEYSHIDRNYSFEDAANLVYRVFSNLDQEFADIFVRFLSNGHIDVYPKKGKRGGAFCSYWLISHPTYVLLNFTNKLRDVTTIAHEMGHGINNELIKKKQNSLNFGTPTSTAEVASTFMEDFVMIEILKTADDETKLGIIVEKLNDEVATVFRQIACYKFEQELHGTFREKGYLSKEEIGKIFQKHMSAYMGKAVEQSKGSENWWVYWWHIRTFFYVYSYASGLLISKSLQNSVKKDPEYIEKVKEFLSTGLSESPKSIFNKLGIDITDVKFWNKGLLEIETLLNEAEGLAKKLGKIPK